MKRTEEIQISLLVVVIIVIVGIISFMQVEGWNFVNALYYVSSTLTTVGSVDLVPLTSIGRIISVIYMWLGVAIVASSIGFVGTTFLRKHVPHYFHKHPHADEEL